jgi:hypothetical protein
MEHKNFERDITEGYKQVKYINAKDIKIGIILNLIALIVLVIVMAIAIPPLVLNERISDGLDLTELTVSTWVFLIIMFAYIVLHELVHGAAYKKMTGEKLTFGISWSCAFCGVPNIYTYTKTAIYASSAPLIVFSILFLALTVAAFFISPLLYFAAAALLAIHLGGCSGDIYILLKISKYKSERLLVRDTGPEQFFYLPGDPQDKQ